MQTLTQRQTYSQKYQLPFAGLTAKSVKVMDNGTNRQLTQLYIGDHCNLAYFSNIAISNSCQFSSPYSCLTVADEVQFNSLFCNNCSLNICGEKQLEFLSQLLWKIDHISYHTRSLQEVTQISVSIGLYKLIVNNLAYMVG